MKKIGSLLLLIVLVSSVSAISTDMGETYFQGETMIVEILGNILQPITNEDIEFFRGHVQIPIDYDVKRIGDNYYFYGITPLTENNYTLKINNILTTVGGVEQRIDFEQNFLTLNETASYSITPGFAIFEKNSEFVINLNEDLDKIISIDFPETRDIILKPGENELEIISIENETGFKLITIGDYSVPIFILESPEDSEIIETNLSIFPRRLESILLLGEEKVYPIRITNEGNSEITDLTVRYNDEIFIIIPPTIFSIQPNETREFNVTLKIFNETISEVIIFEAEGFYEKVEVNIAYTENEEEVVTPYLDENYSTSQGYYCSELGGKACSAEEVCSEDTVQTLDVNNCCSAECSVPEDGSFAWIGFLIGLIILVVLIIIGVKYKKSKGQTKSQNPLGNQIIKAKSSNPIFSSKKKP